MAKLATKVRFRPITSARSPEGSSQHRLTTWNSPSAAPISTREKPRRASSRTHILPAGRKAVHHSNSKRARFCLGRENNG